MLVVQLIMISISYKSASDAVPSGIQNGFDQLWDVEQRDRNNSLSYYEEWVNITIWGIFYEMIGY